jgi:hypothetical protein
MPTTLTERMRSEAPSLPRWTRWVVAAVAIGFVALGVSQVLRGPQFVAQVSFVNPSPYALDLQVASATRDDWMLLGTSPPNGTFSVAQVVDQGSTWVFRIYSQGVDGGAFAVSRSDLVRSGWRVTIPSTVIVRLQAQNIPVPPAA